MHICEVAKNLPLSSLIVQLIKTHSVALVESFWRTFHLDSFAKIFSPIQPLTSKAITPLRQSSWIAYLAWIYLVNKGENSSYNKQIVYLSKATLSLLSPAIINTLSGDRVCLLVHPSSSFEVIACHAIPVLIKKVISLLPNNPSQQVNYKFCLSKVKETFLNQSVKTKHIFCAIHDNLWISCLFFKYLAREESAVLSNTDTASSVVLGILGMCSVLHVSRLYAMQKLPYSVSKYLAPSYG